MPPTLLKKGYIKNSPESIPIDYIIRNILDMRNLSEKVLILKATTGSGKSTVLPPELYKHFTKSIVSLQPRVFNALNIPINIIKYNQNFTMGINIGYSTGRAKKLPVTGLTFMTYGTFFEQFRTKTDEEICSLYEVIIIDEAHEMEIPVIKIHYILKEFLKRCKHLPNCPIIIITSATFDYKHFAKYYETENILKVKGFSYPIEEIYLKYDTNNYIKSVCDTVHNIYLNNDDEFRDIIIFVYGEGDFILIEKELKKYEFKEKLMMLKLNSQVIERKDTNYHNLFKSCEELQVYRKIIVSTNVGETGITYPYLKYVIDTGFVKLNEYNCDYDLYSLRKYPINYFAAQQRRGRVGREAPGVYYAMYSNSTYKLMEKKILNKLYTDDISSDILTFTENLNVLYTDLIYTPSSFSIWRALEKLYLLGYINPNLENFENSKLAQCFSKFTRLTIEQFKILIAGYYWGAAMPDLISIVAWLNIINDKPKFTNLNVFTTKARCDFIPIVQELYYINESKFKPQQLIDIAEIRDNIIISLNSVGYDPFKNIDKCYPNHDEDYVKIMKMCIYEGLKLNMIHNNRSYSGMNIEFNANYVVYNKIQLIEQNGSIRKKLVGISILDNFINIPQDFASYNKKYEKTIKISAKDYIKLSITDKPNNTYNIINNYNKPGSKFSDLYDLDKFEEFCKQHPKLWDNREIFKQIIKKKSDTEISNYLANFNYN